VDGIAAEEEPPVEVSVSDEASDTSPGYACSSYSPPGLAWWFDADYMMVWTTGNPVPPLVTTSRGVPPREQAGVLGAPDTHILYGGKLDEGMRSGVRLTGGVWLDECRIWGLQAGWFSAGDPSDNDAWQSPGVPVLARPFFNAGSGLEDAQLVAYPGVVEGMTQVATDSDLESAQALVRWNWVCGPRGRVDFLGGYRYLRFQESLMMHEHLILRGPGGLIEIGSEIDLYDRFDAGNDFHGGQIGVLAGFEQGCLALDIGAKLGLGNVQRRVTVDGWTMVETPAGDMSDGPGGLLALPSNMGRYEDDQFALLPELDLKLRILSTERLSASIGYNLMFLTQVYRTGEQIDRSIDTDQLPGFLPINDRVAARQLRPAPVQNSGTLRAQSLSLGLSWTY
jgi:hypothetical protein